MIAPQEISRAIVTPPMDARTRIMLMALRQALLIALGALEEYMGLERSVTPKHRKVEHKS